MVTFSGSALVNTDNNDGNDGNDDNDDNDGNDGNDDINSLFRIGAYEPVKRVYVDNSGQTSGLGLMGCRIAAGITTGIVIVRIWW